MKKMHYFLIDDIIQSLNLMKLTKYTIISKEELYDMLEDIKTTKDV